MIQDGQKIVLDSFTNFKFMMGEKTRFSKLMKWIKDTQDDVHFIHKGMVLSKDYPTSSRRPETRSVRVSEFPVPELAVTTQWPEFVSVRAPTVRPKISKNEPGSGV